MRALVVDDARTMRLILKQALQKCGFDVIEAASGKEGIEQLAQLATPDVALVDCYMPDMDGLEFVRAVRAAPGHRAMPMVMVTAEEQGELLQQALAAGANDFVAKPFTGEVLRGKLQRLGLAVTGA